MGAWAEGSFDNDDALDWVWELEEADISILEEALSRVIECEDYIEAPDCTIGVAAAEVVAALDNRSAPQLPSEVLAFVNRIATPPSAELRMAALKALQRIKTKSELQELWEESGCGAAWQKTIAELESRLS